MPGELVILGAVAGSIGIATSVATVIKLLDKFSIARNAPTSINILTTQLDVERLRFFLWCNNVGYLEMLVASNDDGSLQTAQRPDFFSAAGGHLRLLVEDVVGRSIANLQEKLESSQALLRRYTVPKEPDYLQKLRAAFNQQDAWAKQELDMLAILEERRVKITPELGWTKKAQWSGKDQKEFEGLLLFFRQTVDNLQNIQKEVESQRVGRQLTAIVTTTSLTQPLAEVDMTETTSVHEAYSLAQLALREEYGSLARLPRQPAWRMLRLTLSDLKLPTCGDLDAIPRVFGHYDSKPVLVEWRYYPRNSTLEELETLKERVHMLAIQLQQSSKLAQFQLLSCLGHFHDEKQKRFGMVFAFPKGCTERPVSLRDLIALDTRSKEGRDLDDRWRAARLLASTMYSLFSVRWIHKNVSADSILFFSAEKSPSRFTLSQPFICAFDLSRSDGPAELTETLPSRTYESQTAFGRRVYKHPDLDRVQRSGGIQHPRQPQYRREYDVYSLGIVLLELGYWRPVERLVREISKEERESLDLTRFRDILEERYIPELRHKMGRAYAGVVANCLSASFKGSETHLTDNLARDDYLASLRQFLDTFDKLVVSELEKSFVTSDK